MLGHWTKYTSKSGQSKSFMFHHTTDKHNGQIGSDNGKLDYKAHINNEFTSNLLIQTEEGMRNTAMERLQSRNKVNLLNSRLDFCQPFRNTLTYKSRAVYQTPGGKYGIQFK